ncbi:hypothetical protein [uncultured Flavobacterium sp.]|uniref:hypothetical protein n=1 Tax=uncultured Flavobacterium sp. TaxID=165435 RepID=UPI0025938540|nr:hypothetical protein [uncultured Flavobacterium sp.]
MTDLSGYGIFHTAFLQVLYNLSDFNLQRDFDFTFKFNHEQAAWTDFPLFSIYGDDTSLITGIYAGSNRIGVKVKTKNTEALQTVYSANNTYTVGGYANYKFERRGSTLSVYFNNALVITVTLPTDFSDINRNFRLGTDANGTFGGYGRFDDFKFFVY